MKPKKLFKLAYIFYKAAKHPSGGFLFYCPDDGTVLLTRRSEEMSNPLKWDIPGGRHSDEDDSALDTAVRESKEEIGNLPQCKIIGKHIISMKNHNYDIFMCEVSLDEKKKWTPTIDLDYESTTYKWFDVNNLPTDTHIDLSWVPEIIRT